MLKIIPVLDILGGTTVHAVRGQRQQYKPLESRLCVSTRPLDVALTFKKLGFTELYVADLDAILGIDQRLLAVRQIAEESKMRLMVDAGISDLKRAKDVFRSGASKLVIGTETLASAEFVRDALCSFGRDRIIVSLDMTNNEVLGSLNGGAYPAMAILRDFCSMGLAQVIVLDLSRVGSGQGVNINFLKQLLGRLNLEVFVGGGVRNLADLLELRELGLHGVLVATALHSGVVTLADLIKEYMEI